MKFTEWWDFRGGRLAPADTMYRHRDLKNWCGLAYNDGITEGLRRAAIGSEAPTQGGGSQEHQIDTWSDSGQQFIRDNFR